ncbi:carbon monoxide dehydrogenase subunit G [Kribbella pratensis]|uniref:Carbon monoxide dehydrogenase subunit G n=1 Tax=Kribbella pratensis TaxID=2512112 RepID=A0ABY2FFF9_9ACTN|nr:SRPBCC family protein [Kribbella pratensis]TDW90111.1 carbon monoxide dehydrogenase subunit G [Kribbella pratensis]
MSAARQLRFTNTITIDRPPAEVFEYLAHLENVPRWNYAIGETRKITNGPVGVGARYLQTRTIPVHAEETLEITEFEPDRGLSLSGTLSSMPARISYTLHPDGNATTLTNTIELQPPRHLALVAPIAVRRIKSAVAANLAVLQEILERA